jgi:ABC-type cobalamin/Fe3+-siderophores transport system ATPase subunit
MTTLMRFDTVHFAYGQRTLLPDATFALRAGSCTALIGPNGAGKTTLLRMAAGVLRPISGRVLLGEDPLHRLPARQIARSIALVPQHLELPFPFTVQQVVEQGRTPYLGLLRGATREDRAAVDRALDLTDATGLRHRIFNELSGGERQRVKIALGLAQQPKLLLLDEPTQNLDIGRQVELIDLLHHLRAEGITVLASIHDLHLVRGNFDRVLLLSPGEPLRSGSPEEMLQPALLERAFNCPPNRHPVLLERAQAREGRIA